MVTPDLNEPECSLHPDSPINLEETKINAIGSPFCIVWLDEFDDEQGFQIHLTYFHSGERFIFEVKPNITQLVIPENQAPRLTESLEQCMSRNSFMIEVVAYWPDKESSVGSFGMDIECGGPGETPLPTATIIAPTLIAAEAVLTVTPSIFVSNGDSGQPSLSGDGQRIVFLSYADNLVLDDTNGQADVFLYDRDRDTISRMAVANDGQQFAEGGIDPAISFDGQTIAFSSKINSVLPEEQDSYFDIFIYDDSTKVIEQITSSYDGNNVSPRLSGDGNRVVFVSEATNILATPLTDVGQTHIYQYNRQTGTTQLVDVGIEGGYANGASRWPDVSADGEKIVFASVATNLTADIVPENSYHIYLYQNSTRQIELIGQGSNPAISPDGGYIAFWQNKEDGRYAVLYDIENKTYAEIAPIVPYLHGEFSGSQLDLSNGGAYLLFWSGILGEGSQGIFLYERATNSVRSIEPTEINDGVPGSGSPAISADGRWLVFESRVPLTSDDLNEFSDIFLIDNVSNEITLIPNLELDAR